MSPIQKNRQNLLQSIARAASRIGREPSSIQLLAVSKAQSAERVLELARLGQRDFGENYAQEWLAKRNQLEKLDPQLAAELRWHFIGHLQSNKAALVVGQAALLHSVDSRKLAQKISALALAKKIRQPALFEINLGLEGGKSGMDPETFLQGLADLVALPGLEWRGLMAIPPALESAEAVRPYFRRLKSLLDECNRTGFFENPLTELSMGMSQDFEVAIECGANMVRVGTAIFGEPAGEGVDGAESEE